jgi:superfamily II DNA or RNA helicase
MCGGKLLDDWHADHIIPYSKGGQTTIQNGQALCKKCNLSKSNHMNKKQFVPRQWQRECFVDFFQSKKKRYFIEAVPGAGKSKVAAHIAWELLSTGEVDYVFAVSPQGNKKQEWYEDFLVYFGIYLDPQYSSTSIFKPSRYQGAILTYQGINEYLARDIQSRCKNKRVLVIADEPHHLSEDENRSWGVNFKTAFQQAEYMIFLSGTYWREDGHRIPFMNYDESEGRYIPDYSYSYIDSLQNGNSRKIYFEFFDPEIKYENDTKGIYYEGLLSGIEKTKLLDKCYRMLVKERSEKLKDVLQSALINLEEIRVDTENPMPNAGMIIFAPDQDTAYSLKNWLNDEDFGYINASVVTSDDENSKNEIDRFKKSNDRVIIAINMISEGVDIPRLRVGVYLSIYKTFLYFMQSIVGRLIRVTQDEYNAYQTRKMKSVNFSYAYILKHPLLFDFARQVENEIYISEIIDREKKDRTNIDRDFVQTQLFPDDESIDVLSLEQRHAVISGNHIDNALRSRIQQIVDSCSEKIGQSAKSHLTASLAELVEGMTVKGPEHYDPVKSESDLSNSLKDKVNKIAGRILSEVKYDDPKMAFRDVRFYFMKMYGSLNKQKADISDDTYRSAISYAAKLNRQLETGGKSAILNLHYEIQNAKNGKAKFN